MVIVGGDRLRDEEEEEERKRERKCSGMERNLTGK